MAFTTSPSRAFLMARRLFPPPLRAIALKIIWSMAGLSLLFPVLLGLGLLGIFFMVLAVALAVTFAVLYFSYGLEEPPLPETLTSVVMRVRRGDNENIIPWCAAAVVGAFPVFERASIPSILSSLIKHDNSTVILKRMNISRHEVLDALASMEKKHKANKVEVSRALAEAAERAVRLEHERIEFADALIAFARASVTMRDFLFRQEFSLEDFDAVACWEDRLEQIRRKHRRFWARERLFAIKPFGREWSYGYTPTIDRFSIDLTESVEGRESVTARTLGRVHEIAALERSLAKTSSSNALVVYEPGIGVRDLVAGFASRVLTGRSLPILNYRRVLAADFGSAIAGLKTAGEIEGRVRKMLHEATYAGGAILVVENFHQLLGGEMGGQPIDLTATFMPYLEGSSIQVVATTTYGGLHKDIEKREGMLATFERIEAKEPSEKQTVQILLEALPFYERRFGVYVPYATLKAIVELSNQTIQDVPFPRKAFDVMEETMIAAQNEGERYVTVEFAAKIISERTHIPVGALTDSEQDKLKNLEELLHMRVVGQDVAITTIANSLRRARAGVRGGSETRPMGTFLFMGPTGVGKTETAKAIAEVYFGSEEQMLRLDMSEFQGADSIDRLIGSPATKEEGRLSTMVRENPFSVLLLDEFEKMHANVMNLFLPIFDEGVIEDGWGRHVSFTNTLIIATSNAGAEFIREWLERRGDDSGLEDALREEILTKGIFRPELLNRFDGTVVYSPLRKEQVREIANRMLRAFSDELYDEKGIRVAVKDDAMNEIIKLGFKQEFGARELRRVLQDNVETVVANRILEGSAKRGDTVTVTLEDMSGGIAK